MYTNVESARNHMIAKIFDGVKYYAINVQEEVKKILDEAGAKQVNYLTGLVTHVIAENKDDPEVEEARDIYEIIVVNSEWVLLSSYCQKLLPVQPFSIGHQHLFNKITAYLHFDDEYFKDFDILWANLSYYGSIVKRNWDISISHVITTNPDFDVHSFCLNGQTFSNICIVTPDWVEDCLKNNKLIDTKNYNPLYLKKPLAECTSSPITSPSNYNNVVSNLQKHLKDRNNFVEGSIHNDNIITKSSLTKSSVLQESSTNGITTPKLLNTYYGHIPDIIVPPEVCLISCVIYIDEYPNLMPAPQIESWKKVVRLLGGEVLASFTQRCTHLITSSRSELFKKALSQNVRCVSAHWLNDCVAQKLLAPPWKPLHIPVHFTSHPGEKEVVSITNFLGEERTQIKHLLWRIGATYTGNLNQSNTLLISRSNDGPKVKKAREWGIPVVNLMWLLDCVYQNNETDTRLPHVKDPKYVDFNFKIPNRESNDLLVSFCPPVRTHMRNTVSNETILLDQSKALDILESWTTGLSVEQAEVDKKRSEINVRLASTDPEAQHIKSPVDEDETDCTSLTKAPAFAYQAHLLPQQKKRLLEAATAVAKKMASLLNSDVATGVTPLVNSANNNASPPTAIFNSHDAPNGNCGTNGGGDKAYIIMITGITKSSSHQLEKKVQEMKGQLTENPLACSHLVMDRVKRTIKFFCAISHCRSVLNSQWIIDSHKAGHFLPEDNYILKDKEAENTFNFCLKTSLYRAQHRDPLFQHTTFYLTPKVEPPPLILKPIIESAGGCIMKQRPSARQVSLQNKDKNRCIIISCPEDLPLCKDYINQNISVHNVELILTGLLQQNLNFELFKVQESIENN